jgi:hypothetical protein
MVRDYSQSSTAAIAKIAIIDTVLAFDARRDRVTQGQHRQRFADG